MKQTLYLMRHGQTLFNLKRKIQGASDSKLTPLGIHQAEVARNYFQSQQIQFDAAYSSTLERACDTLEIVTNGAMPYKRLKGLKEWNFGLFEGESEDLNPPLPYGEFFVPYGGESELEVRGRLKKTLHEIVQNDPSESILIVTHGAAIFSFMRAILPEAEWKSGKDLGFTNCSAMVYEYENGTFTFMDVINHSYQMKH